MESIALLNSLAVKYISFQDFTDTNVSSCMTNLIISALTQSLSSPRQWLKNANSN